MADARRGTVITVFSTASAVGKTLIAINIGVGQARLPRVPGGFGFAIR